MDEDVDTSNFNIHNVLNIHVWIFMQSLCAPVVGKNPCSLSEFPLTLHMKAALNVNFVRVCKVPYTYRTHRWADHQAQGPRLLFNFDNWGSELSWQENFYSFIRILLSKKVSRTKAIGLDETSMKTSFTFCTTTWAWVSLRLLLFLNYFLSSS